MALSNTQQFTLGVTTCTLPAPVAGSIRAWSTLEQAVARAADGTVFVDDKAVTHYHVAFRLQCSAAQASALENFFRSTAQGALNSFVWLDHRNVARATCRFDPEMRCEFSRSPGARYEIEVVLILPASYL